MSSASFAEKSPLSRVFGTFGIYRYCLALLVMMGHIAYGKMAYAGDYAVFGFFVLSGYVVSYILNYDYLGQEGGLGKYALNRALRIYPPFWVASLFLLWLIMNYHPERTPGIDSIMGYPETLSSGMLLLWVLLNLTALNSLPLMGAVVRPTIMPVGWSLGIEIFYWILIPFLFLRPRLKVLATAFAVAYTLWAILASVKAGNPIVVLFYFSPLAGSLPFLTGLYCFEYKQKVGVAVPHALGISAMVLFLLLCFTPVFLDYSMLRFYFALALNTTIVLYLGRFDQRQIRSSLRKIDSLLGDLAYPIFVLHVPVAMSLHVLFPGLLHAHVHRYFLLAFLCTNTSALLLHYVLEVPVNRIRSRIRRKAPIIRPLEEPGYPKRRE